MDLPILLSRLVTDELIHRFDSTELSYLFKHALTQESAYESLLKSKRAELHRTVAASIEWLAPDQLEQNAPVLAFHYDRAGIDDKAFTFAVLAGDIARRAYANDEARAFYNRALEIAQRLSGVQWTAQLREVYINRGNVFEVQSNHSAAIENYQSMIAFAQRVGDLAIEADAINHLATVRVLMHTSAPETAQLLERALSLAKQSGDQEMICRTLWNFGLAYRFEDPPRAAEYLQQALEMARTANLNELVAFALVDLLGAMRLMGRWKRGIAYGLEALESFKKMNSKPMIADVLGGLGAMWLIAGDMERSRTATLEGVQICETIGNPWGLHVHSNCLAEIAFAHGEILETLVAGERLLAGGREIGFPLFTGLPLMLMSRARLELNHLDQALALAEQSAAALAVLKSIWVNYGQGYLGRVYVRRGELEHAREILAPLWRTDDETAAQFYGFITVAPAIAELSLADHRLEDGLRWCDWFLARCEQEDIWGFGGEMYFLRGRINLERNNLASAELDLNRARAIFIRAENRLWLWQVEAAVARLYAIRSENELSRQASDRAKHIVTGILDKMPDIQLRQGFMSRSDVSGLMTV